MTRPYSQTHIQGYILGLVLQLNSLKLKSCKFNVIINIIFGSGVAVKPKTLGCSFTEKPNIFKS
jgi:hypothetical protein